jgi:hypothetical protein
MVPKSITHKCDEFSTLIRYVQETHTMKYNAKDFLSVRIFHIQNYYQNLD